MVENAAKDKPARAGRLRAPFAVDLAVGAVLLSMGLVLVVQGASPWLGALLLIAAWAWVGFRGMKVRNELASALESRDEQARRSEAEIRQEAELAVQRQQDLEDARSMHEQAARRFASLFNGLPVACFTVNESLDIVEANSRCESLFGLPVPQVLFRSAVDTFLAGPDAEAAAGALQALFEGQSVCALEWCVHDPEGAETWIHWQGIPMRDGSGQIVGVVNAVIDLTDRKSAELALMESENRFRAAIDSLQEGFILVDADEMIRMVNPPAARMLNSEVPDLIERPFRDLAVQVTNDFGQAVPPDERPVQVALRTGKPQFGVKLGVTAGDMTQWVEVSAAPLFRPGAAKPYAVVAIFSDITVRWQQEQLIAEQMTRLNEAHIQLEMRKMELEEANERLEQLATTDGLTNLVNHRTFQERLGRHMNDARKYDVPLSIVLMDIDHFKRFNDTFGHLEGDNVLRSVAGILALHTREGDIAARYGGEEFVVLLPATTEEEAIGISDRLRCEIMKLEVPGGQVTASFGVATLSSEHGSRDQFIHAADTALYQSKHDGRNRVTHIVQLRHRQAG